MAAKAHQKTPLTPQQSKFVSAYIIDLSPTNAAKATGYAQSHAYHLLKKPHIQAAIQRAKNNRLHQASIDSSYVLRNLVELHTKAIEADDLPTAARVLELLGRHAGVFEKDNHQKNQRVSVLLNLSGDNAPTMLPMPNNQEAAEATVDQLDASISVV